MNFSGLLWRGDSCLHGHERKELDIHKYAEVHDTHSANQPLQENTTTKKIIRVVEWSTWSAVHNFNPKKNSWNRIFWLMGRCAHHVPTLWVIAGMISFGTWPFGGSGCLKNRRRTCPVLGKLTCPSFRPLAAQGKRHGSDNGPHSGSHGDHEDQRGRGRVEFVRGTPEQGRTGPRVSVARAPLWPALASDRWPVQAANGSVLGELSAPSYSDNVVIL